MNEESNEERSWAEKNVPVIYGISTFVVLGLLGLLMNLCG